MVKINDKKVDRDNDIKDNEMYLIKLGRYMSVDVLL